MNNEIAQYYADISEHELSSLHDVSLTHTTFVVVGKARNAFNIFAKEAPIL